MLVNELIGLLSNYINRQIIANQNKIKKVESITKSDDKKYKKYYIPKSDKIAYAQGGIDELQKLKYYIDKLKEYNNKYGKEDKR